MRFIVQQHRRRTNTANGYFALFGNTTGNGNTATGFEALVANSPGNSNTAGGAQALGSNSTGDSNTADGAAALMSNNGDRNTAIGAGALALNISASDNTAIGLRRSKATAPLPLTRPVGAVALEHNSVGDHNTAVGFNSLATNTMGADNMANGDFALSNNDNTAIGYGVMTSNIAGNSNTALGDSATSNVHVASNVICIGANVAGEDISNSCYVGSIFGQTSENSIPVLVNSANRLGTAISSKRFKEDIKPMDQVSEALFSLKLVKFR